jgi:hypothetical protein
MSSVMGGSTPPVRRALWQKLASGALSALLLVALGWLLLNRGQPEWIQLLVGLPSVAAGCAAVVMFEWHLKAGPARQALAAGAVLAIFGACIGILQLDPAAVEGSPVFSA